MPCTVVRKRESLVFMHSYFGNDLVIHNNRRMEWFVNLSGEK